MYFLNKIKEISKDNKVAIFVDMDGVITDFDLNKALDFKNKRPIITNINTLSEISNLNNTRLYILSVCVKDYQIKEKNDWLDKYAPFFKIENRIIISKEKYPKIFSRQLKEKFLREKIKDLNNEKMIVIDDDNNVLRYLKNKFSNVIFFQDSSIID